MTSLDEFKRMQAAVRESDGAALRSDLDALRRSVLVFTRNCHEFLTFLDTGDDPIGWLQLWSMENREGWDDFLDEFTAYFTTSSQPQRRQGIISDASSVSGSGRILATA